MQLCFLARCRRRQHNATFSTEPHVQSTFRCHTYEHDALLDWLQIKSTSPLTGLPICVNSICPNYALNTSPSCAP